MSSTSVIQAFLLGKLPDGERDAVEQRLLVDDEFGELVSAVEEELIDEYIEGELSDEDAERFQSVFLVTEERQRRLRFSAALRTVAREPAPELEVVRARHSSNWFRWASAAAALIAVGLGVRLTADLTEARRELEVAVALVNVAEEERYANVELEIRLAEMEAELAELRLRPPGASAPAVTIDRRDAVVVALVEPGSLRTGAGSQAVVEIRPATMVLQLRLDMGGDDYDDYTVALHDDSGAELIRLAGLDAEEIDDRVIVTVRFAADSVSSGDHSARLWGRDGSAPLEELDRYYVRVHR